MFSRDDPAEDYYGGWAAEQREWRAILQHSAHCPRAAGGQPATQSTIQGVANAFFAKKPESVMTRAEIWRCNLFSASCDGAR